MSGRWRSGAVRLALVGAGGAMTTLGGCGSGSYHRNVYQTMQDCASDYSMLICSQKGQQDVGKFLGPAYRMVGGRPSSCPTSSSSDPGGGSTFNSRKIGVERAGFGYFCRSRSSGS